MPMCGRMAVSGVQMVAVGLRHGGPQVESVAIAIDGGTRSSAAAMRVEATSWGSHPHMTGRRA
jgi:hypothetical protein